MEKDNIIILKPGESMHNHKSAPKSKVVGLSEEESLYKLNKKEQTKILEDLGVEKIPKLEKDKVALILKLRK